MIESTSPTATTALTQPEARRGALPTIGVDPGARWTAACLRVDDHPANGWTLGPVDRAGALSPAALDDPDDWYALQRYITRIGRALDELVDEATTRFGGVRIGIEVPRVPVGYQPGASRYNRLPLHVWLVPKLVAAGVIAVYPDTRLVAPDKLGHDKAGRYPRELRGTRPLHWGPCEARRGERDHERAAYDVAGLAAGMP